MKTKPLPSRETLLKLLQYDPKTGSLYWKERSEEFSDHIRFNKRYAGKPAFTCISRGYQTGTIEGVHYKAVRVIWKMVHGYDPEVIDHIDGNKLNNRISNIRNVTQVENTKNRANYKNNTSGYPGVNWIARLQKWQVTTGGAKHRKYHGTYASLEEAISVKKQMEKDYGYHQNHGR
ncbi:putative HNH endonuclease [Sulfitobacter phage EE36phi1]|uniref:Putative HNH endonuclease n=1 Tax=Sulfitobacter phage EE36phi1 TaxID=490913 RepID=C4NT91_9CAUD|nr:HNH endonuclease [Sulfitobacter phage EE36phi1]ACL81357.1 putative HNH endonuclease [Sulfitobacter phage EE36phi1]